MPPFLHDLVSCLQAPTVALSGTDGQIRPGGVQGVFRHDRRVLSGLVLDVDGHEPVPVGHRLQAAGRAQFVSVVQHVGDPSNDPTVRLERERRVRPDGLDEQLSLVNAARTEISVTVRVRAAADLAGVTDVKRGTAVPPLAPAAGLGWADQQTRVTVTATGEPTIAGDTVSWPVTVPAGGRWQASLSVVVTEPGPVAGAFLPAPIPGWDPVTVDGPADLAALVDRGIGDLAALALADPLAPADQFLAAGSPWYFTLFGRDSLWAARFALPLGTDLARGTLRTLARRQGRRHDPQTGEAPGKILHEVRTDAAHGWLPPVYFGSVDATALWVCLLHDAWRWGMAAEDVEELLDPLEAALGWLLADADADGDGFLEYIDLSGQGLANQGWKDSADSIQFPDGTIAEPPIALSEAQAYAYEAAIGGARLLAAFGRPGGDRLQAWAARLRQRFREAFWVSDSRGRFPAIALDGSKRPVGTATSNLGHLLGTGLLDPPEAAAIAARLRESDLDSGYGLRTMSADAAGFNPIGYHTGSIWPHDTAIAIRGLVAEGHPAVAASLSAGLLRAAPAFEHRLPELFAGTDGRAGEPALAYPASCRPQAWSAAAPLALLQAALGLAVDVPDGTVEVRPRPEFAAWFPLRISGLRVAGRPLEVTVDAAGRLTGSTPAAEPARPPRDAR
ncbi:MAG TPA: glycogen debranching N-terminal domain-containing protein [Natronosporangium sp.]